MFSNIITWIFSKTKVGKLVDGNKTIMGFALLVLRQVIVLLAAASSLFPQFPSLAAIHLALVSVDEAIGPWLEQLGLGAMAIGVGHKAIKESEAKKPGAPKPIA